MANISRKKQRPSKDSLVPSQVLSAKQVARSIAEAGVEYSYLDLLDDLSELGLA